MGWFRRGVGVFTVSRTDMRLDGSWVFVLALLVWSLQETWFPQAVPGLGNLACFGLAVLGALAFLACLVLQETAQLAVARRMALRISRVTLYLFGGVAEEADDPPSARAAAVVAVAGPLASLALAALFWLGARGVPGAGGAVLSWLALVNLILALFNLVPAYPLDGGQILWAAVWHLTHDLRLATRISLASGMVFAWALMILGALMLFAGGDPMELWLILTGMFLWTAAHAETRRLALRDRLQTVRVQQAMTRQVVHARPEQTLSAVATDLMLGRGVSFLPVLEVGRLVGVLDLDLMRRVPMETWPLTRVAQVMEPAGSGNTLRADAMAYEAMMAMLASDRRKRVVVQAGQVVGIVTAADILKYLGILEALIPPQAAG